MPTEAEIWQAMHGAIPGPASAPVRPSAGPRSILRSFRPSGTDVQP